MRSGPVHVRRLSLCGWLLTAALQPLAAGEAAPDPARPPLDYFIVVTGHELLTGVYPDAHTQFLTRTLLPLNVHCIGSLSVDDRPADLQEALRFAASRSALVIVTGGLGPTDDDITRQTLAAFTGIPLAEQPDVLAAMERRFRVPRDQLRANLRRQTQVPTKGTYLKSAGGTAVGLVFEAEKTVFVALPGPPRELQPMVRDELVPYLHRRFGSALPGCALLLRFVGVGQSQIDQTLKEHVPLPPDMLVTTQFEDGRVDYTFALPTDTPECHAQLDEIKQHIREHLGAYIYAADATSLEQRVLQLLADRGGKLALAEVGSGGRLAAGLLGLEDAPRVLAGAYAAPTEEQLRCLLRIADDRWDGSTPGEERLRLLATAAAAATGSAYAVAIGDVQRAADGTHSVPVVFQLPNTPPESQRLGLRGTGESARASLATQLLDALRRRLPPAAR